MRFAIVGSGAVGGYYGAKLAQAGHDVTFVARGAHLAAIRAQGLAIKSPLGDFLLSPFAGFTGAARVPIGPLWTDPSSRDLMIAAFRKVEAVGRAAGVALPVDLVERIVTYVDSIPPSTRSSLLIDLQQGKPIEVDALLGAVVRRGAAAGVATPIAAALYAVLKPYANGPTMLP